MYSVCTTKRIGTLSKLLTIVAKYLGIDFHIITLLPYTTAFMMSNPKLFHLLFTTHTRTSIRSARWFLCACVCVPPNAKISWLNSRCGNTYSSTYKHTNSHTLSMHHRASSSSSSSSAYLSFQLLLDYCITCVKWKCVHERTLVLVCLKIVFISTTCEFNYYLWLFIYITHM